MPRGRKRSHKGGHRHFTSEDDMEVAAEKERKEREWRHMKGIESDEEETPEGAEKNEKEPTAAAAPIKTGEPGELPPGDSDESEDDEDEEDKPKGVAHLIEIENPNRMKPKAKKISELNVNTDVPIGSSKAPHAAGAASSNEESSGLSRREREELEKQAAKERYDKMHQAGKTDEARADLARLALIRRQREEAAKKRDEEKKAQDDVKTAAEQRLLDKKNKTVADTGKH